MRIPLVNSIALALCVAVPAAACSRADARPASASLHDAHPNAVSPGHQASPTDSITTAADSGRIQGDPTAKTWVVEISDLQCPYCKQWHDQTYPQLRDQYIKTGKIRFAYVNFPLTMHQNAMPAARAAMCASVQRKFWEMQDAMFATQDKWESLKDPMPFFEDLATKNGVKIPAWKSCLSSHSIQALIDADRDRSKRAGAMSTPSFLIGGRLLEGAVPIGDLSKVIDDVLGTKKG